MFQLDSLASENFYVRLVFNWLDEFYASAHSKYSGYETVSLFAAWLLVSKQAKQAACANEKDTEREMLMQCTALNISICLRLFDHFWFV